MIHPGLELATELKSRKINQIALSKRIGIAKTQLNEVLNGKRPISTKLALSLEWLLIGNAQYWITKMALYELELARESFNAPKIN